MARPYVLDNTVGAAFIGMIIAAVLHGVSVMQALYYYTHQKDSWPTRLLVGAVILFDTTHQILISHIIYTYTISNWGNPAMLNVVLWSGSAEVVFNGVIAVLVQSFLTRRVWQLSDKNKLLTGVIVLLILGEFGAVLALAIKLKLKTVAEVHELEYLSNLMNALAVAGDIMIAGALCTFLHLSRTGFERSNTMIDKLILFAVNTGLFTSFCAIASLVAFAVAGNTLIHLTFYFCIGRLYTNSLLATLNARKKIQALGSSFRSIDKDTTSVGRRQRANISIKIDRTRKFATDSEKDCVSSGLEKVKTENSSAQNIEMQEIKSA